MPIYVAVTSCFHAGRNYEPGDRIVASELPSDHFVLSSAYKPYEPTLKHDEHDQSFVRSSTEIDQRGTKQPGPDRKTHDTPSGRAESSRLANVNPRGWRF